MDAPCRVHRPRHVLRHRLPLRWLGGHRLIRVRPGRRCPPVPLCLPTCAAAHGLADVIADGSGSTDLASSLIYSPIPSCR